MLLPLKDSLRMAAFVVESVRDAKDDGERELMARLANDQARSLVQFVLKELEIRYGSNIFDTFDAYRNINTEELRGYIKSRFGNKLFLDGFTNLSDAQIIFLSRIIPLFDKVCMTLDPALMEAREMECVPGYVGGSVHRNLRRATNFFWKCHIALRTAPCRPRSSSPKFGREFHSCGSLQGSRGGTDTGLSPDQEADCR